jgi:predicted esterase
MQYPIGLENQALKGFSQGRKTSILIHTTLFCPMLLSIAFVVLGYSPQKIHQKLAM